MPSLKTFAISNAGLAVIAACGWTLLLSSEGRSTDVNVAGDHVSPPVEASFVPSPLDLCASQSAIAQRLKLKGVGTLRSSAGQSALLKTDDVSGKPVLYTTSLNTQLRCAPHEDSTIVSGYGLGHRMLVVDGEGRWLAVRSLVDGKRGWVQADQLGDPHRPQTRVTSSGTSSPAKVHNQTADATPAPASLYAHRQASVRSGESRSPQSTDSCVWKQISRGHWSCVR